MPVTLVYLMPTAPPITCPDPSTISEFLSRTPMSTTATWSQHAAECPDCRTRMAASIRAQAPDAARKRIADWLNNTSTSSLTSHLAKELTSGIAEELLLGPYLLTDLIARGGMGAVYRGWHTLLRRVDAIKVMRGEYLESASAVKRFLREVEAAARLRHPNVVAVHSADRHGDRYYLAMEFIRGEDLGKRTRRMRRLPSNEACSAILQASRGLQHAHEMGLVHRDIKPGNLLREDGGRVLVADFGIARVGDLVGGAEELTRTGSILGTPAYMAPEQAENIRATDIRADLYSLGATFFYLLAGRPPFVAESMFDVIQAHRTTPAPDVRTLNPDVPANVAGIIARLLAKPPGDRFQTPGELAEALAALQPTTTAPLPLPIEDADETRAYENTVNGRTTVSLPRPQKRRNWLPFFIAGGLALLAVGSGITVLLLLQGGGGQATTKKILPTEPTPSAPRTPSKKGEWSPTGIAFEFASKSRILSVGYGESDGIFVGHEDGTWAKWNRSDGKPIASGKLAGVREGNVPEYFLPASKEFLSQEFDRWTTSGSRAAKLPIEVPGKADVKATYLDVGATSSDGKWFAGAFTMTGGDSPPRGVAIWEPTQKAMAIWWPLDSRNRVKAVAVSRDGQAVAVANKDGKMQVWKREGETKSWNGPKNPAEAISLTSDGRTLYSVHELEHELYRWDTTTGKGEKVGSSGSQMARLVFSPDDRWLVAAGYGLRVWRLDPDLSAPIQLIEPDGIMFEDVAFNPTGVKLLAGGRPANGSAPLFEWGFEEKE